jgi:hypothetical protein
MKAKCQFKMNLDFIEMEEINEEKKGIFLLKEIFK